jgi:hypothetical protein
LADAQSEFASLAEQDFSLNAPWYKSAQNIDPPHISTPLLGLQEARQGLPQSLELLLPQDTVFFFP